MVAGGLVEGSGETASVELVSLDRSNEVPQCLQERIGQLPEPAVGAVGAVLGGVPTIDIKTCAQVSNQL